MQALNLGFSEDPKALLELHCATESHDKLIMVKVMQNIASLLSCSLRNDFQL